MPRPTPLQLALHLTRVSLAPFSPSSLAFTDTEVDLHPLARTLLHLLCPSQTCFSASRSRSKIKRKQAAQRDRHGDLPPTHPQRRSDMACIPTQPTLNEVELLVRELQLRMTQAVEASPRLDAALQEPRVLYAILADYFESQLQQAQQAKGVALEIVDVRRVWAFCLAELALPQAAAPTQTLYDFVYGAPSLPLEALQRAAPVVDVSSAACAPCTAGASVSSCTARREAVHTSVFSILRSGFAGLMDVAYVADQRLQRPLSSATVSVVSLAALSASLVPTLDRVQAVRLTAQLADDLVDGRATSNDGSPMPPYSRSAVATLLAGVWYTWGMLDAAHSPALHSLGEHLFQEFATSAHGLKAPAVLPVSFAAWLQHALRVDSGVLHKQLYADAERMPLQAKNNIEADAAVTHLSKDNDTEAAIEDVPAVSEFWARLAS
ncbi:hypothetical protein LtaPh_2304200 [Leishmania tarentolae]|uniref:Uncharacterized protein n=1 Tax=Leishmania tarentolae TaxID=5689 RepID=A0A640KGK8_LEITA|nr:hypothetical protein LtaPh_2304200 [Leishmania tarentolae]